MDITDSLAPASDQLDAIELATGPRIFTVKSVSAGNVEQPVQVHLVEFPRPWRPGKNMRRVLAACWGTESSEWTGRRVELYLDPDVTFGKETPGGTRIAKLSHIDKQKKIPLLVSRGKSATYTVDPLSAEPTTAERIASLRAGWKGADADQRKVIEAEVEALSGTSKPPPPAAPDPHPFAGTEASCDECGQATDAEIHRP